MVNIAPRLVACWLVAMIPIELSFINGGFMFPGDARIAGCFFLEGKSPITHDGSGWCWYINANMTGGILMGSMAHHI